MPRFGALALVVSRAILAGCSPDSGNAGPLVQGRVVNSETGEPVTAFQIALKPGTPPGGDLWYTRAPLTGTRLLGKLSPFSPGAYVGYAWRPDFVTVSHVCGEFIVNEMATAVQQETAEGILFVQAQGFAIARKVVQLNGVRDTIVERGCPCRLAG